WVRRLAPCRCWGAPAPWPERSARRLLVVVLIVRVVVVVVRVVVVVLVVVVLVVVVLVFVVRVVVVRVVVVRGVLVRVVVLIVRVVVPARRFVLGGAVALRRRGIGGLGAHFGVERADLRVAGGRRLGGVGRLGVLAGVAFGGVG